MITARRDFLKLTAAGVTVAQATAQPNRYNLLFLMADQHNPHVLGCAGDRQVKTPNLDRIARQGTMFQNAYCTYPICVPARQSVLTGKYPHSNGVYSIRHILDEREFTIADRLQQSGYRTGAIGKMHFLDDEANHGFEDHIEYGTPEGAAIMPEIRGDPQFERDQKIYGQIAANVLRGGPATNWVEEAVVTRARRFMRDNRNRPFALWVSFGLPHWHWVCSPDFYYMYDPAQLDLPRSFSDDLAGSPFARRAAERRGWLKLTEEQHRLCRARYYGATSAMDHYVGQVLAELDTLGLTDRTLVVFTSDHGEMCAEHRMWEKAIFYEGSVRIPLIMRMPGRVPAGRVVDGRISHVDLLPSLSSLLDLRTPLPGAIDGEDLSGTILGKKNEGREYLYSEMNLDENGMPGAVMVRWNQWSYCQYREDPPELYNLESDPHQLKNSAASADSAAVVKRLQAAVSTYIAGRLRPQFAVKAAPDTHPLSRPRRF